MSKIYSVRRKGRTLIVIGDILCSTRVSRCPVYPGPVLERNDKRAGILPESRGGCWGMRIGWQIVEVGLEGGDELVNGFLVSKRRIG